MIAPDWTRVVAARTPLGDYELYARIGIVRDLREAREAVLAMFGRVEWARDDPNVAFAAPAPIVPELAP